MIHDQEKIIHDQEKMIHDQEKIIHDQEKRVHITGNRYNVKGKLLKDSRGSEVVCFGKNASVDGDLSKSQVKRSFGMSNCDICEFSKTMTACELAAHNDQLMAPVGWCHSGCPVPVFYYQSIEVTFREKLHNLCENIFADVHTCSNLHLNTKEQNSKGRQGFHRLGFCA